MKTITLSYTIQEIKTFNVPQNGKWAKWFKAWEKDEDDRTDADWNLLDKYYMEDFLASQGIPNAFDVECYNYE